jgi:hypothetical protein
MAALTINSTAQKIETSSAALNVRNVSDDTTVYYDVASTVTDETGMPLGPGEFITLVKSGAWYFVCASGETCAVRYYQDGV